MFHKPKDLLKKSKYSKSHEVYNIIADAYQKEAVEEKEFNNNSFLNTRMVEGKYKVPILTTLENKFYVDDHFFVPNEAQSDDERIRKNAQNCLKILFDFTNLKYKDIFKLLTDDYSCQLWVNDLSIDPNKHAVKLACLALGLDKIFAKDKGHVFSSVKKKIDKLIHMNTSYEQKATVFSFLVEKNKALQNAIFSHLKTKPCKYSDKFDTRYDAKVASNKERRAKKNAVFTSSAPAAM